MEAVWALVIAVGLVTVCLSATLFLVMMRRDKHLLEVMVGRDRHMVEVLDRFLSRHFEEFRAMSAIGNAMEIQPDEPPEKDTTELIDEWLRSHPQGEEVEVS